MSVRIKTIIVLALTLSLGAAALASDATEWIMRPEQGHFVDMQSDTTIVELKNEDAMMARAEVVKPGTVFFKHGGRVMVLGNFKSPAGH